MHLVANNLYYNKASNLFSNYFPIGSVQFFRPTTIEHSADHFNSTVLILTFSWLA